MPTRQINGRRQSRAAADARTRIFIVESKIRRDEAGNVLGVDPNHQARRVQRAVERKAKKHPQQHRELAHRRREAIIRRRVAKGKRAPIARVRHCMGARPSGQRCACGISM